MENSLVIIGGIIFNILASFCLKYSYVYSVQDIKIANIEINVLVVIAVLFYFCAFGLYYKSLQDLELSKAQPIFTIGTMLGVGSIGVIFFNESFDWKVVLSYCAFVFGILLLSVR